MFPQFKRFRSFQPARLVFKCFQNPRDSHLFFEEPTITRYEVFQACHQPDETYSSWLSARLVEWASLSGRADEPARERRSGWCFPVLVSEANHAAFDRYLQDWLSS